MSAAVDGKAPFLHLLDFLAHLPCLVLYKATHPQRGARCSLQNLTSTPLRPAVQTMSFKASSSSFASYPAAQHARRTGDQASLSTDQDSTSTPRRPPSLASSTSRSARSFVSETASRSASRSGHEHVGSRCGLSSASPFFASSFSSLTSSSSRQIHKPKRNERLWRSLAAVAQGGRLARARRAVVPPGRRGPRHDGAPFLLLPSPLSTPSDKGHTLVHVEPPRHRVGHRLDSLPCWRP